jgi:pimeloyl-ACP methyl ester carboxylesterase
MPTAQVAGYEIAYETYGNEANPAVFRVHGLYFDHVSMGTLAERLADAYFVVAHDALGHGHSAKPAGFTLADQAGVLTGLIDELDIRQTAVLGEAMGAYIALLAAKADPGHIDKLVLLAPKAKGKTSSMVEYFEARGVDPAKLTMEERVDRMADAIWCPETLPERRQQIIRDILPSLQLNQAQSATVAASMADFDLTADLPEIQASTIVFSGQYDGLNPPERGREVARLVPGARFELFEHSGHLLKYEEQVKTGDLLRQFLDE